MRATLIWHYEPAQVDHRDWIRFLLSDVVQGEIVDLQGAVVTPCSIVVEDNRSPTPASFFELARRNGPVGLFHISDQYFSFDYKKYRCFDFVLKTHWSAAFEVDRLMVVPIGYQSDMPFKSEIKPGSQRTYLWSFAGVLKASRFEMVKALRDVKPNYVHAIPTKDQRITKTRYFELLENSVFAPCPMGNVIMESHRLYESLEAGCIPILEKRLFVSYHEHLLQDPPLIFVRSWREAKRRMLALAADRAELDRLQHEMYAWWQHFKKDLKKRVTALANEGLSRRIAPPGVRVKPAAEIPGWHYMELLRHQSATALLWRVQRNLLHGRLRTPF